MRDFLRKWKKNLVFVGLLSCFINILQLTFAFYMFTIYRNIVSSYHLPSLYTITIIALYALVSLGFFSYLRIRLLNTASVDMDQSLGDIVFKNVVKSSSVPGRRAYTQGLGDLNTLKGYFNNPGIYALFDAPWAPLYLLLIYFFHPVLGIVATVGAMAIFSLSVLQDFLTRKRLGAANSRNSQNQQMVSTALRNAEVINSMGMTDDICNRWDEANAAVVSDQTIASKYAGAVQSLTRPLQVSLQVFIYGIGAYLAISEGFDVGLMVAAAIIMGQAVGPIMRAMGAFKFTLQARASYDRLSRYLAFIEHQPAKMSLPAPEGRIEARQLFVNAGQVSLLKNVSFDLKPGEFLGIIGPSGAGKSTLCRVLTGVWPSQKGEMRLDDVDLFYWDKEELGIHMGYLAQDVELFEASLAKNIARMGVIDDAQIQEAAQAVDVDKLIESLPQGYDTSINGPAGVSLSGGQRQRIGIARAIYGNPRILVLDEPNSNLDIEGDKALLQMLSSIKSQGLTTCAIVSHKPEVLDVVDKILILKDGQVAAFGPKDQVFAQLLSAGSPLQQAG